MKLLAYGLLAAGLLWAVPARPSPQAGAPERISVAVLDLTQSGSVPAGLAATLTGLVATELGSLGVFSVISREDIRVMLTHEAEAQMLGCGAGASCMTNIGGALGVRYLLSGSVDRVGPEFVINLALSDVARAKVPGRVSLRVRTQAGLVRAIARGTDQVVAPILADRQATLIVVCDQRGATVQIDGHPVGVTPLARQRIGWGPHRLEVDKTGFVSEVEDFTVRTRGLVAKSISLVPSPDFLATYDSRAHKMRLGAWLSTGAGVVAAVAAGYFQYAYDGTATRFGSQLDAYDQPGSAKTLAAWQQLSATKATADGEVLGARVAGGLALACAATAAYFWIAGDDPGRYARYEAVAQSGSEDASPERSLLARVAFGWGRGGIVGASLRWP